MKEVFLFSKIIGRVIVLENQEVIRALKIVRMISLYSIILTQA